MVEGKVNPLESDIRTELLMMGQALELIVHRVGSTKLVLLLTPWVADIKVVVKMVDQDQATIIQMPTESRIKLLVMAWALAVDLA